MKTLIKTFDELTVRELYDILRLRADVFVVEQTCPYPDPDGRDEAAHHLMVREGDALIAYLRILPVGVSFADAASIGRVVVRPDSRGTGLARPMMLAAMAHAYSVFGVDTLKISAQVYLADFYASLGFRAISEAYLEDGIPHIDMVCYRAEV